MPYLLDTNHWIYLPKGRCPPLARRLDTVPREEVWFCSVVKEELVYGKRQLGQTMTSDICRCPAAGWLSGVRRG